MREFRSAWVLCYATCTSPLGRQAQRTQWRTSIESLVEGTKLEMVETLIKHVAAKRRRGNAWRAEEVPAEAV